MSTPYDLKVLVNRACEVVCTRTLTRSQAEELSALIEQEYMVNWCVHPAARNHSNNLSVTPERADAAGCRRRTGKWTACLRL